MQTKHTNTRKRKKKTLSWASHYRAEEHFCPGQACVHKPLCLNAAFLQVHYSVDITSGLMEKVLLDTENESRCQPPWVKQAATKI